MKVNDYGGIEKMDGKRRTEAEPVLNQIRNKGESRGGESPWRPKVSKPKRKGGK